MDRGVGGQWVPPPADITGRIDMDLAGMDDIGGMMDGDIDLIDEPLSNGSAISVSSSRLGSLRSLTDLKSMVEAGRELLGGGSSPSTERLDPAGLRTSLTAQGGSRPPSPDDLRLSLRTDKMGGQADPPAQTTQTTAGPPFLPVRPKPFERCVSATRHSTMGIATPTTCCVPGCAACRVVLMYVLMRVSGTV